MPDFTLLAAAVVVSASAAAVTVLLTAWASRRLYAAGTGPAARLIRIGWPLGLGLGAYAGCGVLGMCPRWPAPEDRDRFLAFLLPLTLIVEITAALILRPRWIAWLPRLALAAVAAPILLWNSVYLADLAGPHSAQWSPTEAGEILAVLAASLATVWALLSLLQAHTSDRTANPVMALTIAASAVTVMLSGYYQGGQMGLVLAGSCAGAALASLAAPNSGRGLGVGIVYLFTLLLIGRFFGELPTAFALGLGFAPLLAWLSEAPGVRKLHPAIRAAVRLLLVAVPLVLVVIDAKIRFDEASAAHFYP